MVLLRMHTYLEAVRERQLQKRILCGERKRLKMKENGGQKLTINDVAEQLGVSTSTVSRAISGKGRIGSATRKRVLDFIEEHDYHPNSSAKSLAQSKTNNIAILIPEVSTLVAQPFFYMCMCGVNEVAQARGYDMFVVPTSGQDTSNLKRLLDNEKVDGVILGNTHRDDAFAKFLQSRRFPFVAIGSLDDDSVIQVNHDNMSACRDLTALLLSRRMRKIAYMGKAGDLIVNEERYEGYLHAYSDAGMEPDKDIICMDNYTETIIRKNVDELVKKRVDCIVCQDDSVCNVVLQELYSQKVRIPEEMRVASCHNSKILDSYPVSVTTLIFDNTEIGRVACGLLLDLIDGKNVRQKTLLDYQVVLKESTK